MKSLCLYTKGFSAKMGKDKKVKQQRASLAEDIVDSPPVKTKSRVKKRPQRSDKDDEVGNMDFIHPLG